MTVYRAYNNGYARGIDSNHRITTDYGAYLQTIASGWIGEGVVVCAAVIMMSDAIWLMVRAVDNCTAGGTIEPWLNYRGSRLFFIAQAVTTNRFANGSRY